MEIVFHLNKEKDSLDQFFEDDAYLVTEAQKNPFAFSGLYKRWEVPVYQYFFYRTGNSTTAEDLTSQLFLSVYQSIGRYKHRGHFAAWMFTIARNLVARHYRKNRYEASLDSILDNKGGSDPSEEHASSEEIEHLKGLVSSLPLKEQELIRLRYAAGLKFSEIALILHKSEDSVKKSLYRLQSRLQRSLESKDD
jgi:RNA polymerase sigma-70 factor (ECF subfamily)